MNFPRHKEEQSFAFIWAHVKTNLPCLAINTALQASPSQISSSFLRLTTYDSTSPAMGQPARTSEWLKLALSSCIFFLSMALVTRAQEGQILRLCPTEWDNFTSGSQYESNLNSLLPSLVSNAVINIDTYYNTSVGAESDRIYGYAQCMSASTASACRSCLNNSIPDLRQLCPREKQATVRYSSCIIRYSDERFFSKSDNRSTVYIRLPGDVKNRELFDRQLGNLMKNLSNESAFNSSRLAWGSTSYNEFSDLYGLAQCTRDLPSTVCSDCLLQLVSQIPSCCQNNTGSSIYYPTCNIQYQTSPFDPASRQQPPPPPATPSPPPNPGSDGDGKNKRNTVIIAVVCAVTAAMAAVATIWICLSRKKKKGMKQLGNGLISPSVDGDEDEMQSTESLLFDLATLRAATDNFSDRNKLGQGGFGPVYKGKLPNGQEIAVKRLLTSSSQGIKELRNEVVLLAKLQHRNLVRLLGCCTEEHEKLLVYEYVLNASLDKFLFDPKSRAQLNWETRYKIIVGIARGLLYLHEDSRLRIIHRDLKAGNILLDQSKNPKISDFGLAKLFGGDQTQADASQIAGTYGYMAPEYAIQGHYSTKSDVYSFGVLVLEIVTGRKNTGFTESESALNLLTYIWRHWNEGTVLEVRDQSLGEDYHRNEVLRCIHLGLLSVQEDPSERPFMSTVVLMLSSQSITLPVPSPPAFCLGISRMSRGSLSGNSGVPSAASSRTAQSSINEMSVSEFYPR
ncbi:cysteine-rich receptor-like protein kinase 25 [Aristolochia californica]|uniref:cysteine-rich receptor-like protein kinase 25 n=1 Tax=Aristolochia californica TaxID=171875 RepID=UPI0035E38B2D